MLKELVILKDFLIINECVFVYFVCDLLKPNVLKIIFVSAFIISLFSSIINNEQLIPVIFLGIILAFLGIFFALKENPSEKTFTYMIFLLLIMVMSIFNSWGFMGGLGFGIDRILDETSDKFAFFAAVASTFMFIKLIFFICLENNSEKIWKFNNSFLSFILIFFVILISLANSLIQFLSKYNTGKVGVTIAFLGILFTYLNKDKKNMKLFLITGINIMLAGIMLGWAYLDGFYSLGIIGEEFVDKLSWFAAICVLVISINLFHKNLN